MNQTGCGMIGTTTCLDSPYEMDGYWESLFTLAQNWKLNSNALASAVDVINVGRMASGSNV